MSLGKSLLLTHPARLGDTVLSLPVHRAIAARVELESNVGQPFRFLLDLAGVKAAYSGTLYPKGIRDLLREARGLRDRQFDAVFLVRPNFRSALLAKLARIRVRVGDPTEGRGPLLTHRVTLPRCCNQLERLRAFGEAVGLEVPLEFGLPATRKMEPKAVGIVPVASYSDKFIPEDALLDVCERVRKAGYRLVLLGAENDRQHAGAFLGLDAEDWIGKFTLPELIEPLSSLTAVIAADGGLYHLSVGCGVPSVGVYGPTASKCWWHDWGPHKPVLAPGGVMANVTADLIWEAATYVFAALPR